MKPLCPKVMFEYDSSTQIFHKLHKGNISVADIVDSWAIAFDKKVVPKGTTRFIFDFRNANFDIEVNQIKQISNYYQANPFFKNCRMAVITSKPADVVVPILVQRYNKSCNTRPFSTMKEAKKWILF